MADFPRQSAESGGFSLIEIVLAVGIISFALVGILGLFPVALEAAAESQAETQAAFIAQQIYTGLRSPSPFLPDSSSDSLGSSVDLRSSSNYPLYFGQGGGQQVSKTDDTLFEADVVVSPSDPEPGLTRVEVSIATPPDQIQTVYTFVSLLPEPTPPNAPQS